ncbi:MAG TPA: YesL family protein, partial [Corynebacterium amycolatum]|nr:YesL family protein [Corynebacterium amycolatum]
MDRFFSTDTKFYAAWSLLADLVIINLLMIVASIPIVTAGAATRAGVVVARDMVRDEGSRPVRRFLRALLDNWRTPTLWWLFTLVLAGAIGYEFYVISRADLGAVGLIFAAGVTSGALILLGITAWVYSLCSLSDGQSSLRRTLATATSMTVKNLPRTALAV